MPPPERTGVDPAATAAAIERAGFRSAWVGGGNATPDAFARLRPLLAGSENLIVATGIANVWAWEPARMRAEAEDLAGEFSTVLDRVREHLDAGADHVVIQPLGADGGFAVRAVDELAAALTELTGQDLRGEAYEARSTRQPRAGRR